jgi:tetratricopeptide (TPR) repeat protein
LRAAGSLQQARERLAFVKSDDPAYSLARYHLGDIALDLGDPQSAVGYFQELARSGGPEVGVFAEGGLWRALTAAGKPADAQRVLERLESSHPDCLALLEIRHDLQKQREALAAQAAGTPNPARVPPPTDAASPAIPTGAPGTEGRYCLQFGAFSDRRLALGFQMQHKAQVPDLRIDRVQDARGQYVYKVRAGIFPDPAPARAEAGRLRETLGLDVFVTELEAGAVAQE